MPVLLLLVAAFMTTLSAADPVTALQGVRRIAVFGDSITQDGNWVADVECALLARGLTIEVLGLGLGSETASDLTEAENAGHAKAFGFPRPPVSERLDRALAAVKPDLVIACYGMNDGSSLPTDDTGTKRYAEAITRLREHALQAGAKRVVLCSPPVKEAKAEAWATNKHDQNLTRYATWLVGQRSQGWEVVDIHTPMRAALDQRRQQNPAFQFAKDSVHPAREGHWVMAQAVLDQWLHLPVAQVPNAEALFPAKGAEIRALVRERQALRYAAWMTAIGHKRPGVPGGPKAKPGLPLDQAEAKAAELTAKITALLAR